MKPLLLMLMMVLVGGVFSNAQADVNDLHEFKRLAILHEGRVKPLDTFARSMLLQISGKDTYNKQPAINWLARTIFNPTASAKDRIFLINNPDIAVALGIEVQQHRRYTFEEIHQKALKLEELYRSAINIDEKERSILEQEIVRVFQNVVSYQKLTDEMRFVQKHDDFTIKTASTINLLGLPAGQQYSFIDVAQAAEPMREVMVQMEKKTQDKWSDQESDVMRLSKNLLRWSVNYQDLMLTVIPPKEGTAWLTPWDAITTGFGDELLRQQVLAWQKMAIAFNNNQSVEFSLAAKSFAQTIDIDKTSKFDVELVYNAFRPFFIAKCFYVIALICFVVSFMGYQAAAYKAAWISIIIGFIPHTLAFMARIIIMGRPPVTNLYETFIFVAFIAVLLGIFIELYHRKWLGLVVAAVGGLSLLFVASRYSAEGDTMKMLVAVLNSNFWLGTHVLTITMGYGATCVAGIVGHVWLIQAMARNSQEQLDSTYKIMLGMLGLSLCLTFLGTNLGGIWADQSWGRFWGWDPKENGALMIVLWVAMLLHAKVSKMIGQLGMAIGAVMGVLVVVWAWFGVNLLSIGLHSYGFTSGVANSLCIFAVAEIVFMLVTFSYLKGRRI